MASIYHIAKDSVTNTVLYYISDSYSAEIPDLGGEIIIFKIYLDLPPTMNSQNCYEFEYTDSGIVPHGNQATDRMILLHAKLQEAVKIYRDLHHHRSSVLKKIHRQDEVYRIKLQQAHTVLNDQVQSNDVSLVQCFADIMQLDLINAAKIIIEASRQDNQYLIQTEILRQKYMNLLRTSTDREQVVTLHRKFIEELLSKT